jgi:hypothetical protein
MTRFHHASLLPGAQRGHSRNPTEGRESAPVLDVGVAAEVLELRHRHHLGGAARVMLGAIRDRRLGSARGSRLLHGGNPNARKPRGVSAALPSAAPTRHHDDHQVADSP